MSDREAPRSGSLDARLARLPRQVAPERDLWPGIETRLTERRSVERWPIALGLAASAAALCVGLVFALHRAGEWRPVAAETSAQRLPGPATRSDPALPDARLSAASPLQAVLAGADSTSPTQAALDAALTAQVGRFPPEIRERLLRDVEIIRSARADIVRALRLQPQSPLLQELLAGTWQQEMDYYANLSAATAAARL